MGDDTWDDPKAAPTTAPSDADIMRFPHSRVTPAARHKPFKQLGNSRFAARYGSPDRQATGHWCSACQGIWFGYLLEVTCPVCGNRRG